MRPVDLDTVASDAVLGALGEPVTLADGRVVVGVFEHPCSAVELRPHGTRASGRVPLSHQEAPVLWLATGEAAALVRGETVTVREVAYLIADLIPDGAGLTRVDLLRPGEECGPRPDWRHWR